MEDELPLKLIELSDFLRSPSTLSKRLQFKQTQSENSSSDQPIKHESTSNGVKFKDTLSNIVLLKQKAISTDHPPVDEIKPKELILPKDIIVFADEVDRKKLGIYNKCTNLFSRHLLITSGAALQALIPSLTNAKEWIIVCKLKYSKRFTKQRPIHGDVIMSLNVSHPYVRYEILTALELLQQSFNEIKSAYIVMDFSRILIRWFKTYLRRTDQYPSLSNRLLYRYQFQSWKCSVTLGKRQYQQDNDHHHQIANSFKKILHKSDVPMQIYIDFNSLPANVYSIELNNILIYSINNEFKQIIKDIGNGLSLVSIQDLNAAEKQEKQENNHQSILIKKEEVVEEKVCIPKQQEDELNSTTAPLELNEEERMLFEKLWNNRIRIQMQHEQLMTKAARLLCSTTINNDSINRKNQQLNLQTMNWVPFCN